MRIKDKIYEKQLSTNIKCYIIVKSGFKEKQATVGINFGSADTTFLLQGEKYAVPKGTAHFLEHKLFEEEKFNVFDEFSKNGASANAYTNFNNTAYYFNCSDNFNKNLSILLNFVSNPYFTDENVEKEKGIIGQEISMYDDDPMWRVYFNLLKCLYFNRSIIYSIAGNKEDIEKITKETLYNCYKCFYTGDNAVVVCIGDINPEETFSFIENNISLPKSETAKKTYENEPDEIKKDKVFDLMPIERTLFNLGIKENDFNTDYIKKICTTRILLDIIIGEGSLLYENMYNKGLIDSSFYCDYTCGINYGFSILSGFSDNSEKIKELFFKEVDFIKKNGIDKNILERIKKKQIGKIIKGFNSIDSISSIVIDFFNKGANINEYIKCLENVTINDLIERIETHFKIEKSALSLIKPQK